MSTATNGNGESINFNEIGQSTWLITEPGVITWDGTNIDIVCDFIGPIIYFVRYHKNKAVPAFSLEDAKLLALKLSRDILEMGYEL